MREEKRDTKKWQGRTHEKEIVVLTMTYRGPETPLSRKDSMGMMRESKRL